VNRDNLPWLLLAALLLVGGWLISQRTLDAPPGFVAGRETFREWLWGTRNLDLAVQVGIVFVGALGIAALLPRGDEAPEDKRIPATAGLACDLPSPQEGAAAGGHGRAQERAAQERAAQERAAQERGQ
jgi:hypothetical protein